MEFQTTIISPDQPVSTLIVRVSGTDMTLYSQFKRSRVVSDVLLTFMSRAFRCCCCCCCCCCSRRRRGIYLFVVYRPVVGRASNWGFIPACFLFLLLLFLWLRHAPLHYVILHAGFALIHVYMISSCGGFCDRGC